MQFIEEHRKRKTSLRKNIVHHRIASLSYEIEKTSDISSSESLNNGSNTASFAARAYVRPHFSIRGQGWVYTPPLATVVRDRPAGRFIV